MAVQIIGAPISTFTRTIRMALEYLAIPYEIVLVPPHSEIAYKYNPFGKIPTLVHDDYIVNETLAMRIYIDGVLGADSKNSLSPANIKALVKTGQWISTASDYAFKGLILSLSKPRQALEAEGKREAEILSNLEQATKNARQILRGLEKLYLENSRAGQFLVGPVLTWADLFLYPIMADFCALPERVLVKEEAPALFEWYTRFEGLDIARATYVGTIAEARL